MDFTLPSKAYLFMLELMQGGDLTPEDIREVMRENDFYPFIDPIPDVSSRSLQSGPLSGTLREEATLTTEALYRLLDRGNIEGLSDIVIEGKSDLYRIDDETLQRAFDLLSRDRNPLMAIFHRLLVQKNLIEL